MKISKFISALLVSTAIVSAASATDYKYDNLGRLVEEVSSNGAKTVYTYNQETGAQETKTTYRADGTMSSYNEYKNGSRTTSLTYQSDGTTISSGSKTTYNSDGTIDKKESYSNGNVSSTEQYTYSGNTTTKTTMNSSGTVTGSVVSTYNDNGKLIQETTKRANGTVSNERKYDSNGKTLSDLNYKADGTTIQSGGVYTRDSNGNETNYKYYSNGNLYSETTTDPATKNSTKTNYSTSGSNVGEATNTYVTTYDGNGTRVYATYTGAYTEGATPTRTEVTTYNESGEIKSKITYTGAYTGNPSVDKIKSGYDNVNENKTITYKSDGTIVTEEKGEFDTGHAYNSTTKTTTVSSNGTETVAYSGGLVTIGGYDDMLEMLDMDVSYNNDGSVKDISYYGQNMDLTWDNGRLVKAQYHYDECDDCSFSQQLLEEGIWNQAGSLHNIEDRILTFDYDEEGRAIGYTIKNATGAYNEWITGSSRNPSEEDHFLYSLSAYGYEYVLDEDGNIVESRYKGYTNQPDIKYKSYEGALNGLYSTSYIGSATFYEDGQRIGTEFYDKTGKIKEKNYYDEDGFYHEAYYYYDDDGNLLYTKVTRGRDEYGNDVTLCYDASGAYDASCSSYYEYDSYGNKLGYYSGDTQINTYSWSNPNWQQDILNAEAAAEAERIAAEQAAQAAEEARIAAARAEAEARERERMLRMKRIYTIEEASALSKDTGNTIRLRYR